MLHLTNECNKKISRGSIEFPEDGESQSDPGLLLVFEPFVYHIVLNRQTFGSLVWSLSSV